MPNNKPFRNYAAVGWLVTKLTAGLTGPLGWIAGIIAPYIIRWLAQQGVYFIDIGTTYITTNMDESNWVKIAGDSWAKVEKGVDAIEGKAIDEKFKKAFDKFVIFSRVSDSKHPKP